MAAPAAIKKKSRTRAPTTADWLLLIILIALGGSSFTLIRGAIETIPPAIVSVGRLWIAAAMLFGIMRAKNRRWPQMIVGTTRGPRLHRLWAWMIAIGIVGYSAPFLIFPWAQQYVASGLAGVYMAFMPLWTLGLAYAFADEQLTPQKIGGFLLGFVGIAILVGPEAIAGGASSSFLAQAGLLLATLLYAASAVMSRRSPPARPRAFSAGVVLAGAVFATPALLFTGPIDPSAWSPKSIASVIALGIGPTGLAGIIIIMLIKRVGAGFMALANYLTPVWAIVAGAVFFSERLNASVFIALFLILAGVAISQRRRPLAIEAGDAMIEEIRSKIEDSQSES
jgi:drug/metabolite transporter (DMT)-like permease